MKHLVRVVLAIALLCCCASAGWAAGGDLFGSPVSGFMAINGNFGINYFDPANGFVPSGFGNSAPNGPNNVDIGSWSEFGYQDGANYYVVNFTHSDMILTDFSQSGSIGITFTFQDPLFAGITLDSQDFPNGVSASIAGDLITIELSGFNTGGLFQANWEITTDTAAPEPSTLLTLASGLLGAGAMVRRRLRG